MGWNLFKRKKQEADAGVQRKPRNRNWRMFSAAKNPDRLSSAWSGTPLSADDVIDRNQVVLVARSREQAANNDYAKQFLRMCRQNIVGHTGVTMQAQAVNARGKLDSDANDAIERAFEEWSKKKHCDVTGRRSWRAIQAGCVNTAAKDGEFFVRLIFGPDAGDFNFSLQVLDPQRCPVTLNDNSPRNGEAFIKQGIGFNRYGRPLSYYFTTTDESEADYVWGGRHYVRIPANEIIHGFLEDMVGQKRGLPWMATGLYRMRQLNAMEEAAITRSRVGANQLGFIEWEDGFGPDLDENEDEVLIDSEPGEWRTLPQGARIKETNPQYPSGEYEPFYKRALRGVSAGFGVLYNNLASDLEGVNFSSIRQGTLDERDSWKDLQEWLIDSLIEPVFEAWLPRSLLSGKIAVKGRPLPAERLDKYRNVTFQPRRWQWIDPRADVTASVTAKNNMLTSPGRIIREQGQDPQTVWAETARDISDMIEAYVAAGIDKEAATELVMISMGRPIQKEAPAAGDNTNE